MAPANGGSNPGGGLVKSNSKIIRVRISEIASAGWILTRLQKSISIWLIGLGCYRDVEEVLFMGYILIKVTSPIVIFSGPFICIYVMLFFNIY